MFANPVQNFTPLLPEAEDPSGSPHLELGQLMARMWTSFVTDLDPNGHGGELMRPPAYDASFEENIGTNQMLYFSPRNC